jgi:aspartate/methionine/tyrosine aminotransferase
LWRDAAIRVLPGGYTARAANAGVNPGSEYIRVAVVHDDATLDAAFTRMRKVL